MAEDLHHKETKHCRYYVYHLNTLLGQVSVGTSPYCRQTPDIANNHNVFAARRTLR
jgi:hypothetical protein